MKLVINGAYYYDKDDDLIVQPCMTGEFNIVDCNVFKRSEESEETNFVKYQGNKYFFIGVRCVYTESFELLSDLSDLIHVEEKFDF